MRAAHLNSQKLNNPLGSEAETRPLRVMEPADEPTRLERLIAAQFRRGIPVPLTAKETQELGRMSLAQRCDHIAKIIVWSARSVEKHIAQSEADR